MNQIDLIEKGAIHQIRSELQRKVKECDEEFAKNKTDLLQANQSK